MSEVDEKGQKFEEKSKPNINDDIIWVSTVDAKIWYKLAHWAKTNGYFKPDERSLLFNIGKKLSFNKFPNQNHAQKCRKLFEKAIKLGFKTR